VSSTAGVRHAARSLAKELVWLLGNAHRPGPEQPICLFATRRGGSTWLTELIAANRGVRPLDQPLDLMTGSLTPAHYRSMPKYAYGELVGLDDEELDHLAAYVELLLSGALPVNAPVKFWRRDYDFVSHRLVLKILAAKALIDWFDQRFDIDVVYLPRHPIPQALSCIRNGWTLTAKAYLRSPRFVAEWLDDDVAAWGEALLRDGTPLEQFVLNWGLENLVPLRLLPERPQWTVVSYEECVVEPEAVVDRITDQLHLPDRRAMLDVVRRPSGSSRRSTEETRGRISVGDRVGLVGGWRRHVRADEERAAFQVLDRLGISYYRPGEDQPRLAL
jgi:hypothetical protein